MWYEGFDDYIDSKIVKNNAVIAIDRMSGRCNGLIAFSKTHNRITFFAVSESADFDETADRLLTVALRQLDSGKDVAAQLPLGLCDFFKKAISTFEKHGFVITGENVIDGVKMHNLVRSATNEERGGSFHYNYGNYAKMAQEEHCPPCRHGHEWIARLEDIMTTQEKLSEALSLYNLKQPQTELIRHNENMTYKITDADKQYVLRIHKPVVGFSPDLFEMDCRRHEIIQSELDIITALKNGTDLPIQTPIYGINGCLVQTLADGTPATLLEWVDGQTVESTDITPDIYRASGRLMAEIHTFFAQRPAQDKRYIRYSYDQTILPRIAERIVNAARTETISNKQAKDILKSLDEMRRRFDELDSIQEKHIVHADLGKSNVVLGTDGKLTPIDFSLCGYSHFYMDLGGIYGLNYDDEGRKYIIEGYRSVRNCEINPRYIEPYFALGVALFIACQYERARDWDWFPGNMERWSRDIFRPLANNIKFILI